VKSLLLPQFKWKPTANNSLAGFINVPTAHATMDVQFSFLKMIRTYADIQMLKCLVSIADLDLLRAIPHTRDCPRAVVPRANDRCQVKVLIQ